MRLPGKIDREEGLLSLDFIIGFTIFMIALIFVAITISGLLVHLQSRTIDYDAVAYRTSVVLVEDPGEPAWEPWTSGRPRLDPPNWHLVNVSRPADRGKVERFGLALSKNYPGVLQYQKIEHFFKNETSPGCLVENKFCVPEDYREKLIFGDYPYNFNITLRTIDASPEQWTLGPAVPEQTGYGYIKRIVKIKKPSFYIINDANSTGFNNTTVFMNFSESYSLPPLYRIDPMNENVTINFTNLNTSTTISSLRICIKPPFLAETCYSPPPSHPTFGYETYDTGGVRTISIKIDPGLFYRIGADEFSEANIKVVFNQRAVNNTSYYYNRTSHGVVIPNLTPAVMEVRIW